MVDSAQITLAPGWLKDQVEDAGHCLRRDHDPNPEDGYATREEALEAARRYRENCRTFPRRALEEGTGR